MRHRSLTVNLGIAASAAALIFLSGRKRFMMPRARVVIHEGSAQMQGDSVKVLDASESYRKALRQMKDYVLEKSHIPATTLARQKNHDWELDAACCLKYGVCDAVVDSMDDII